MDDLYREEILDHYHSPRHRGRLESPDATFEDDNPLCGDRVRMDVRFAEDGSIAEARFCGEGCAISQATASMLCEQVEGKQIPEVTNWDKQAVLDLLGISLTPVRLKCALLPLKVLKRRSGSLPRARSHHEHFRTANCAPGIDARILIANRDSVVQTIVSPSAFPQSRASSSPCARLEYCISHRSHWSDWHFARRPCIRCGRRSLAHDLVPVHSDGYFPDRNRSVPKLPLVLSRPRCARAGQAATTLCDSCSLELPRADLARGDRDRVCWVAYAVSVSVLLVRPSSDPVVSERRRLQQCQAEQAIARSAWTVVFQLGTLYQRRWPPF